MNRAVGLMLASVLASIALPVAAQAGDPPSATLQALLTDEHLGEVSGIVASRRHPGIFWVHNDGDNAAELYAIDGEGQLRATLQVAGVRNVDWEDLAAFESDGKAYLLIRCRRQRWFAPRACTARGRRARGARGRAGSGGLERAIPLA